MSRNINILMALSSQKLYEREDYLQKEEIPNGAGGNINSMNFFKNSSFNGMIPKGKSRKIKF